MTAAAGAGIYYRTDGGDPSSASTPYGSPFNVTLTADSLVITARAYDPGLPASPVETCVLRTVPMRPPDEPGETVPGLRYTYYELANPQTLAAIDTATPVDTGTVAAFSVPENHREAGYGYVFRGYLSISSTDRYKFSLSSLDGSALYIGKTPVVVTDGIHSKMYGDSGIIGLQAGLHEIAVYYFVNANSPLYGGDAGLTVSYRPLGGTTEVIPSSVLFSATPNQQTQFTITSPRPGQAFSLGETVPVSFTYAAGANVPVFIEFSPDGGRSFDGIMELSILTGDNGACMHEWVIPDDPAYVTSHGILMVRDYVLPSVNAYTGEFTIQGPQSTATTAERERALPQLRIVNRRMVMTGTDGFRVELFDCGGRRIACGSEGGADRVWDMGGASSGLFICRIAREGNETTVKMLPWGNGQISIVPLGRE
jgi:hypothetical protein